MNYYNLQAITHVGYIVALTVGMATVFSRIRDLTEIFRSKVWRHVTIIFIFSGFITLLTYFALRVVYWAWLGSWVAYVTPADISPEAPTIMVGIADVTVSLFRNYSFSPTSQWLYFFSQQSFLIGILHSMLYTFLICCLILTCVDEMRYLPYWWKNRKKKHAIPKSRTATHSK